MWASAISVNRRAIMLASCVWIGTYGAFSKLLTLPKDAQASQIVILTNAIFEAIHGNLQMPLKTEPLLTHLLLECIAYGAPRLMGPTANNKNILSSRVQEDENTLVAEYFIFSLPHFIRMNACAIELLFIYSIHAFSYHPLNNHSLWCS